MPMHGTWRRSCLLHAAWAASFLVGGGHALLPSRASAAPFEPADDPVLGPTLDRIDRFVESERRAALVPGMALALVRDGTIVHLKGYGQARPGVPVGPDTGFLLGSLSKSMTAMAILQLASRGKVDLDASVTKYLPTFRTADRRADSITVRELVVHMSGFSTTDGRAPLVDPRPRSIEDTLGDLARVQLVFAPGARFCYSNWNYAILGRIVEAASGMGYPEYMRSQIFAPAGMDSTSAQAGASMRPGMAEGARSFLGFPIADREPSPPGMAPAAFVVSTARDMAAYLALYQRGGLSLAGKRILAASDMDRMTAPLPPSTSYGFGWFSSPEGASHEGALAGYHAYAMTTFRSPRWGLAILFGRNDHVTPVLAPASSFQSRIPRGVLHILRSGDAGLGPPRAGWLRIAYSAAAILVVALAALSFFLVFGFYRPQGRGRPRALTIAIALLLDVVIPLVILVCVPIVAHAQWRALLASVPDVGWLLGGYAVLGLYLAVVKFVLPVFLGRRETPAREARPGLPDRAAAP